VLAAALKLSVDAEATGWVGPRAARELERPEAEPALVHGVVVSDPQLAANLRRCGVFSGKQLTHLDELPVLLARDVEIGEDGQMTPVVVGALDASEIPGFLLGSEEEDLNADAPSGIDLGL